MCYSLGDCVGQIYVALCTYFLTGYYTDTVGIAAAAAGTMMLVARVFDGTTDLVMGALVALFSVPDSFSDGENWFMHISVIYY